MISSLASGIANTILLPLGDAASRGFPPRTDVAGVIVQIHASDVLPCHVGVAGGEGGAVVGFAVGDHGALVAGEGGIC